MTPTTRRFPRSMAEAWQQDNAQAITHYRSAIPRLDRVLGVCLAIAVGVMGGVSLVHWWAQ